MKHQLTPYFTHCASRLFSICLGFLRGFVKHVSLLICMANMRVLLFMQQFLFFLYGYQEGDSE